MVTQRKRYRAFISYSQRDKAVARRLHRALETYRVPKGIDAPVEPNRTLGRFFRDDDEMGASQSLGAALEGALDDSESLIVICSPSASQSKWVDAEVRHFKMRRDARVFAVIIAGEPHAHDPSRECFAPALKMKIDANGKPTGESDEPRAPELQRDGMQRVRAQLAAGLLNVPFDDLWQRDRRRARRRRLLALTSGLVVAVALSVAGLGWLNARTDARTQAAHQAIAQARGAVADGRIGEALNRLVPFLAYRETKEVIEEPLRAVLGWVPDPYAQLAPTGIQPARLRDATVLLEPGRNVYDMSDIGLRLERLIRSRDGRRLIAIGDQRVVVFATQTGERLAQVDNEKVQWVGHTFEAPSGLSIVTGAILGPTNGSVWPFTLTISSDGKTIQREPVQAQMFWGSAVGVTEKCDALLMATENAKTWQVETRALTTGGLGKPTKLAPFRASHDSDSAGVAGLASFGAAFQTRDVFLGEAKQNPFTAAGCPAPVLDDGFVAGTMTLQGTRVASLDLGLSFESAHRWTATTVVAQDATPPSTYLPTCTEDQPCPVVGGRTDEPYVRGEVSATPDDQVGPPPLPRWSRNPASTGSRADSIFFEHLTFNSGHRLTVCRPKNGKDACLSVMALGEDHANLPFLRSPDGRYLFWPFGGAVFDLETLQPLTTDRAIPQTEGQHYDFEVDRPGLTLVFEGRLVNFVPDDAGGTWLRSDNERASARFGILANGSGEPALHTLASLGGRQYLAVRSDGVLARLDAVKGEEVWRMNAVGLGEIYDIQLNPERQHALLMGKKAWRVFRLTDGFASSALLAPPPVLEQKLEISTCRLENALGPGGEVTANCDSAAFAWRPQKYAGEVESQIVRITCAADVSSSALDVIRRCYVDQFSKGSNSREEGRQG